MKESRAVVNNQPGALFIRERKKHGRKVSTECCRLCLPMGGKVAVLSQCQTQKRITSVSVISLPICLMLYLAISLSVNILMFSSVPAGDTHVPKNTLV